MSLLNYQCVAGQVVSSDPNVNDEDTDGNTNDGTALSDPSDLGNGLDDGTTGDDIGPDPGPDPDDATSMGGADQDGTGIEGNTTMPLTTSTGPMPISTQITEESMKPFSFVSWQLSILEDNKRRMNAFDRGFQDSLYTLKKKADLALKSNQTYTHDITGQTIVPPMDFHISVEMAIRTLR
ncbi:hypothetical protein K7432_007569 [Basidiobolus ranarum]|uniref:Uncharacterized protein n=1 Tax=Basidiobolus ranarum TaxID=34480 RepID=A0ABR2W0E5_9FUNG